MTHQPWHCECLTCGHRFIEAIVQVHNAGYDWADSSSYCPSCGNPVEGPSEYTMHEGPIPFHYAGGRR